MDDTSEIYRCTPRQVRRYITECIAAGLVPFVQSSPGMGKSSIVRSVSNDFGLELIDHRLSTSAPEDLSGLPQFTDNGLGPRTASFLPFDIFPLDTTPVPKGKDGWLLFLDEANSAAKAVQAASYKLVLDKKVGQANLHERVAIVMAGNLATDRAFVNPLSTAMVSRVVRLEMQINFNEWLEDVALKENYNSDIIAFLSYKEDYLMDFDPSLGEKPFCCPRTWEFMNKLTQTNEVSADRAPLYSGVITSGVAASFVQFTAVRSQIPDLRRVLSDPTGVPVPSDSPSRWMVISHLAEMADDTNFGALCTYINRFSLEFRVLFFRSAMIRNPGLRQHPNFAAAMGEVSRYLHGV